MKIILAAIVIILDVATINYGTKKFTLIVYLFKTLLFSPPD